MEVELPDLLRHFDTPTDKPTDQPTDRPTNQLTNQKTDQKTDKMNHREITLQIMNLFIL